MSALFQRIRSIRPDYADASDQEIAQALGLPAPQPAEQGFWSEAGDSLGSVARGALGATKAVTDVFGAQNWASQGLQSGLDALGTMQSDQQRLQREEHARRMREAEATGSMWEEVKAAASNFADDPLDYSLEGAGSLATFAPLRLIGKGAQVAGISGRTAGAGGLGAAQGVGAVKGSQYDAVFNQYRQAGASEEDAHYRAMQAQSYSSGNAVDLLTGGAFGLGAAMGVERIVGGAGLPGMVGKGWAKRGGLGTAYEVFPEAAQGGQERFAANRALGREGFEVDPWTGVAGQATQEGLMSAPGGAVAGIAQGYQPTQIEIDEVIAKARAMEQAKLEADRQQAELEAQLAQEEAELQRVTDLRMQYQPEFVSKKDFVKQRVDALFADEMSGGQFQELYDAHRREALSAGTEPDTQAAFTKKLAKTISNENREALESEWIAALDRYAETQEQRKQMEAGYMAGQGLQRTRAAEQSNQEYMDAVMGRGTEGERNYVPPTALPVDYVENNQAYRGLAPATTTPYRPDIRPAAQRVDIHQEAINAGVPISGREQMEARNVGSGVNRQSAPVTGQGAVLQVRGAAGQVPANQRTVMEEGVVVAPTKAVAPKQPAKTKEERYAEQEGKRTALYTTLASMGIDQRARDTIASLIGKNKFDAAEKLMATVPQAAIDRVEALRQEDEAARVAPLETQTLAPQGGPRVNQFEVSDVPDIDPTDEEGLRQYLQGAIPESNRDAVIAYLDSQSSDVAKPLSLRDLAKAFKISHQTVKNAVATAQAAVSEAAKKAGVSETFAQELLGFSKPQAADVQTVTEAQAAQAGLSYRKGSGPKRVSADSEEYDPTYGYDRNEINESEEGDVTQAEAQAAEDTFLDEEGEASGFDPIELAHLAKLYEDYKRIYRKSGAPAANELGEDQVRDMMQAYNAWNGKDYSQLFNQFEDITDVQQEITGGSGADLQDGPAEGGRTGEGQAEVEGVPGDAPSYSAPKPTKQAAGITTVKKRRTVVKPDDATPAEQRNAGTDQTQGAEGVKRSVALKEDGGTPGTHTAKSLRELADSLHAQANELVDNAANDHDGYLRGQKLHAVARSLKSRSQQLQEIETGLARSGNTEEKIARLQEYMRDAREMADEDVAKAESLQSGVTKLSVAPTTKGQPVATLRSKLLKAFNSPYFFDRAVEIVQNENDPKLLDEDRKSLSTTPGKVQGFYSPKRNKVYLIADNIAENRELAVLLHEVGVHQGMRNLLGAKNYDKLVTQLQTWTLDGKHIEGLLARKARDRVRAAEKATGEKLSQEDFNEEHLAYFVEEAVKAGIDPTAIKGSGTLQQWFRTLWAAVKVAIRKLGINPDKLTAQNLVDLAYGAARMELNAGWHGTAARFRKFDHRYMGSGEGAQAYGWGTYLAQRVGIGKEYWKADVRRKEDQRTSSADLLDFKDFEPLNYARNTIRFAANELEMAGYNYADAIKNLETSIREDDPAHVKTNVAEAVSALKAMQKAGVSPKPRVEGSLMRVDTSIQNDELLDWDKPLSEQSELVKKALKPAHQMVKDRTENHRHSAYRFLLPDWEAGAYGEKTAGNWYASILSAVLGSQQAASEYLDSIGIKGIKFLDAASRDHGKRASLEKQIADKEKVIANFKTHLKEAKLSSGMLDLARTQIPYEVEKLAALKSELANMGPQTRNIVVFNDKNIQRIFTEAGANPESRLFSTNNEVVSIAQRREAKEKAEARADVEAERANDEAIANVFSPKSKLKTGDRAVYEGKIVTLVEQDGRHSFIVRDQSGKTTFGVYDWQLRHTGPQRTETRKFSIADTESRPSGAFANVGKFVDDLWLDPKTKLDELKLGWLTLEQMQARTKMDSLKNYIANIHRMQATAKDITADAAKLDREWAALGEDRASKLGDVMVRSTLMEYDPTKDKAATPEQVKLKDDLANITGGEALYKQVRDFYSGILERKRDILKKAAKKAGKNPVEVDKMLSQIKGPYFPLMRMGDWYAVMMSNEVKALMDKKEEGALSKGEEARLASLRKDPKHYTTRAFRSRSEATKAANASGFAHSYVNKQEERTRDAVRDLPDFAKFESYIGSEFDSATRNKLRDMMAEMYFDLLPNNSSLKQNMKREGIYGATFGRSEFARSSVGQAHLVSRLQHNDALAESMVSIKKEAARGNVDGRLVYNELQKRNALAMDETQPSWAVDTLVKGSYLAHLGLSPAYWITNALQTPMITMPWLTARHSFKDANFALAAALVDVKDIMKTSVRDKDGKLDWRFEFDWTKKFPEGTGEHEMFKQLLERNKLDITIEHDLMAVAEGTHSKATEALKMLNTPVRSIELVNRGTTALAAYRLGLKKYDGDQTKAIEHAIRAVNDTQLDYSMLNSARHMQSVMGSKSAARIMMQFRKFQQGMVYLLASSTYDAVKGSSPEVRREAKRTLLGIFATTSMMAGALGVPALGTAMFVANIIGKAFDDDDDPFDAEREYKNWIVSIFGQELGSVVLRGLPSVANVDMTKRVGMADVLSPMPFYQGGNSGREVVGNTLAALGGAPVGTIAGVVEGMLKLANGDMLKGAEKIVPLKLAQNVIRSYRYDQEGMTDTRGNVVVPEDRFSPYDLAVRGMGFSTLEETEHFEGKRAIKDAEYAAKDVRTKLVNKLVKGDLKMTDPEVLGFNRRHPGNRITYKTVMQSRKQRAEQDRNRTSFGVVKTKANEDFMDNAAFVEDVDADM